MRHLLKNERVKYGLMIIGAITVLSGIVIGSYIYLTSQAYSQEFEFLGAGGQNLNYENGEDLKTLVKKQVLSSLDSSGYLTEEELKEVMTDELYNKVIDDVKDRVDTSIANEVANAVDGSTLSDAQIKALVDKEVQNYINSNSGELSEISKIKEQITALKKADSALSTQIASSGNKTAVAGKDGKQGAQGPKGEKGDPGMTTAEVSEVKSKTDAAKTAADSAKTIAGEAKTAAQSAQSAAQAAQAAAANSGRWVPSEDGDVHVVTWTTTN